MGIYLQLLHVGTSSGIVSRTTPCLDLFDSRRDNVLYNLPLNLQNREPHIVSVQKTGAYSIVDFFVECNKNICESVNS